MLDPREIESRAQLFRDELFTLAKEKRITPEECQYIDKAYKRLYYARYENTQDTEPIRSQSLPQEKSPKTISVKPKLSSQDIRDRNITAILIIGVLLVLLAGVIVATTQWLSFTPLIKTVIIASVAGLFFGISEATQKMLKIPKTALAFWTLGCLFLPVIILSAGYFELFGKWLSLFGEGKYLLGLIGALFCLPVYLITLKKYPLRFYYWVNLMDATLAVAFLSLALNPKNTTLYLGISLFNAGLLVLHHRLKQQKIDHWLIQELPLFVQGSTALSSLTFLFQFKPGSLFYAFDLILIGMLYLALVYTSKRKEYSYAFSLFILLGIYQGVENTSMHSLDMVLFAFIGYLFIGLSFYQKTEEPLRKLYYKLSGGVSALVFLFISVKGITQFQQGSGLLFLAYGLITLNYLYLAHLHPHSMFRIATPLFFLAAGYELSILLQPHLSLHWETLLFIWSLLLFIPSRLKRIPQGLSPVLYSGYGFSLVSCLVTALMLTDYHSIEQIVLFLILSMMSYVVYRTTKPSKQKTAAKWSVALFILIAILSVLNLPEKIIPLHQVNIYVGTRLFIFMLIGFIWKKGEPQSGVNPFWGIGFGVMPLVVGLAVADFMDFKNFPLIMLLEVATLWIAFLQPQRKEFKRLLLSGALLSTYTLSLVMLSYLQSFGLNIPYEQALVTVLFTFILFITWFNARSLQPWIAGWTVGFSLLAFILGFNQVQDAIDTPSFIFLILPLLPMGFLLEKYKLIFANIIPLMLIYFSFTCWSENLMRVTRHVPIREVIVIAVPLWLTMGIVAILLHLFGKERHPQLVYPLTEMRFNIYSLGSLLLWGYMITDIPSSSYFTLVPAVLFALTLLHLQRGIQHPKVQKVVLGLSSISILVPFYQLLFLLDLHDILHDSLFIYGYTLPWIGIGAFLKTHVLSREHGKILEYITLSIVGVILLMDSTTVIKGLVLGGLSLIALIFGMQKQIKSYFLTGGATLILNVLIQTRKAWTNLPWWVYLLITGLVLIGVASFNEIQKNKPNKRLSVNKIKDRFKNWE